jgi:two-component system phosphate regulon sensor histidine kinase PhoR
MTLNGQADGKGQVEGNGQASERVIAKLQEERERLETVLDGMSDGIFTVDGLGRLRMYNPQAARMLGLSPSLLKRPLAEALPFEPLLQLVAGTHGEEDEALASVEFELPGHPAATVLARRSPLKDPGGVLVVLSDVTEMRRLETIRRDFVANVSHELRTPISVIQANAETLLDGALDDTDFGRGFVEAIHRNSERLSRLITELLDLSRIEARRYPMDIEVLSVRRAVQRVVDAMSQAVSAKSMQVELSMATGLQVLADSKALDQVLYNLLDNAVKYTPEGGNISIRAGARSGHVLIEVQDDGPGIAPRHRARIFERFYRIDPGRSRDMGGTGLGLAIVKHLVDSMRGSIGVKPAPGGGALFWVTLPQVEETQEPLEEETQEPLEEEAAAAN